MINGNENSVGKSSTSRRTYFIVLEYILERNLMNVTFVKEISPFKEIVTSTKNKPYEPRHEISNNVVSAINKAPTSLHMCEV